jgi:hypothetical protein
MSDLEELLRNSLAQRQSNADQPVRELNQVVAELSAAVQRVTNERLRVALQPLRPKSGYGPTFALTLFFPDEERIMCVLAVRDQGNQYVVWPTYEAWDTQQRDPTLDHPPLSGEAGLREFAKMLLSRPNSELVRVIAYELATMQDESGTLAGSASG